MWLPLINSDRSESCYCMVVWPHPPTDGGVGVSHQARLQLMAIYSGYVPTNQAANMSCYCMVVWPHPPTDGGVGVSHQARLQLMAIYSGYVPTNQAANMSVQKWQALLAVYHFAVTTPIHVVRDVFNYRHTTHTRQYRSCRFLSP